jgi:hypothetical protein
VINLYKVLDLYTLDSIQLNLVSKRKGQTTLLLISIQSM